MTLKNLMDLNIAEVVKTSSSEEANIFLKHGWILIDTYQENLSVEDCSRDIIFVLGRPENI